MSQKPATTLFYLPRNTKRIAPRWHLLVSCSKLLCVVGLPFIFNSSRGQDSLRYTRSPFVLDTTLLHSKIAFTRITAPKVKPTRHQFSNRLPVVKKPNVDVHKNWNNSKKGQQKKLDNVTFNYSSESGLDPSIKQFSDSKISLLSDLKSSRPEIQKNNPFQLGQSGSGVQKQEKDILKQGDNLKGKLPDTKKILEGQDAQVIRSEKLLRKFYDSLISKDIEPPQPPDFMKKEMSKQDMVDQVNKEFNEEMKDEADSLKDQAGGYKDEAEGYKGQAEKARNTDLSKYKLSGIDAGGLRPLAGNIMDDTLVSKVDSLRNLRLIKEGYAYKEKLVTGKDKLGQLKQKQNFWDRSYFDGLLALQRDEFTFIQLSPAYGFKIDKRFSVGAGPNLTIYTPVGKKPEILTRASARTFIKAEIWKQRMYIQIEDGLQWISKESEKSIKHNVLTGVGGLLPFTKGLAINMAVLYRVYHSGAIAPATSPWVFRFGISTVKDKKAKTK